MLTRASSWAEDHFGSWASMAAIPWLIAVLALAILAGASSEPPATARQSLPATIAFAQLAEGAARPTLTEAEAALKAAPQSGAVLSTRLSENYFVFRGVAERKGLLFLTSRHVVDLKCWLRAPSEGSTVREGAAGYGGIKGEMAPFAQGFAMPVAEAGSSFICAQKSTGPAKISAVSLSQDEAISLAGKFERVRGGLMAGVGILVLFMLLAGVVNKDWRYAIFALSLAVGMRVAQISQGTDDVILGMPLALDWMPRIRMISIALHIGLQLLIFKILIGRDEAKAPRRWIHLWNKATLLSAQALIVFSLAAPFKLYLPIMWLIVVNAMFSLACRVAVLMARKETRSETIWWCAMGLGVTLLAWGSEVAAASFGIASAMKWLNNETATAISALMISMAFAQQLKDERRDKVKAQGLLKKAYETSPMGLFEADPSSGGAVLHGNPALCSMFSWSGPAEEMMLAPQLADGLWDSLSAKARESSTAVDLIVKGAEHGSAPKWFDIRAKLNERGLLEGSVQDATERVEHKMRLEFLASHDPLTECLNLRGLEQRLDELGLDGESNALVAYFDLDRFKLINDMYGHEAGDSVLKEVRRRMADALGKSAALGRVGGDEFLAVFDAVDMDDAQRRCEQALKNISSEPFKHCGKSFKISSSAGLVEAAAVGAINARAMIGAADSACRMAKKQGLSQLVAHGRGSQFFERRMESCEIAKTFESDQMPEGLCLLGQPIMSLTAPFDSLNFEMLLRMRKPDGQVIGAFPLIETAEVHGYTAKLDFWVLSTSLNWIRDNKARLPNTQFICVNLSGGSLNDEVFLEKAFALLEERSAEASILCIEITESVALRDLENVRQFAHRVRGLGAKVALDDFGAGYSSFGYLKDLPADSLKIDGALVRDAMSNPAAESILIALGGLAGALCMRSVGEWAENVEAVRMLAKAGFNYAQGYAIAKPLPLDAILRANTCADLIADVPTLIYAKQLQANGGDSLLAAGDFGYL